jgi:hypothetical protein
MRRLYQSLAPMSTPSSVLSSDMGTCSTMARRNSRRSGSESRSTSPRMWATACVKTLRYKTDGRPARTRHRLPLITAKGSLVCRYCWPNWEFSPRLNITKRSYDQGVRVSRQFRRRGRSRAGAGFQAVVPNPKLRLMDQVRQVMRLTPLLPLHRTQLLRLDPTLHQIPRNALARRFGASRAQNRGVLERECIPWNLM